MATPTFLEHSKRTASRKVGLAILEAARRLSGWTASQGATYRLAITEQVVVGVTENGTTLTAAASRASIVAGSYFHDRSSNQMYMQASDSASPDSKFIALTFRLHFSNFPVILPHDLASGFDVRWEPLLKTDTEFTVEIENSKTLLGVAISSTSSLKLLNQRDFWAPLYDKISFESQRAFFYAWNTSLPTSEASLLYSGRVESRSYGTDTITFGLKDFLDELRSPVQLTKISAMIGASVPDSLLSAFQRRVYGFMQGHVPTPIDQVIPTIGIRLTGTVSVNEDGTTVVGDGTAFLSEVSPGDDIRIVDDTAKYRIETVDSDTQLTISEGYAAGSVASVEVDCLPSTPKRYKNRRFLVAGHALSRTELTVTQVVDNATFFLDDTSRLQEGDVLEINGSQAPIRNVGDGLVQLSAALEGTIEVGSTMHLASVFDVYLNAEPLTLTRDFTYDAATAIITLNPLAEFNVAKPKALKGTLAMSNGSRTVTGTNTQFRTQLAIGSWVKAPSTDVWYEVLDITDDVTLTLRTAVVGAHSGATQFKAPAVVDANTILSCGCLGKAGEDGFPITFAGSVAKDLLNDAGLTDELLDSSFAEADELLPHRLSIALPTKMSDKTAPELRATLTKVCRSVFASLVLNNDFQLEVRPLDPAYVGEPIELDESDVLGLSVESDSSQLVAAANVSWGAAEYLPSSAGAVVQNARALNDQYLFSTSKEYSVDTYLAGEEDATMMASRWAFLLSRSDSDLKVEVKLRLSQSVCFDLIRVSDRSLYERFGSEVRSRAGIVTSVKKRVDGTVVEVNDLANAVNRCARISDEVTADYADCFDKDRLLNGFMTDENGLTEGAEGLNLIW